MSDPTRPGMSVPGTTSCATPDTQIRRICAAEIEKLPDDDPETYCYVQHAESIAVPMVIVRDERVSPDAVRLLMLLINFAVNKDQVLTLQQAREHYGRLIGDFDGAMIMLIKQRFVFCEESASGVISIAEVHT